MNLLLTQSTQLAKKRRYLFATILLAIFGLSACGAVSTPAPVADLTHNHQFERMDENCVQLVEQQQNQLETASSPQYVLLATTAQSCIADIRFSPNHPDIKMAMQFNALAVVNFIKAGDMPAASESLAQFRSKFPQRDLLFNDFTSFVDTATLLIKSDEISNQQLAMLNINPQLRAEITRQRKWNLR